MKKRNLHRFWRIFVLGLSAICGKNPIHWEIPTEILYSGQNNLTSYNTVNAFPKSHHANVTIVENGEYWFHTDEHIAFLDKWMKEAIKMSLTTYPQVKKAENP